MQTRNFLRAAAAGALLLASVPFAFTAQADSSNAPPAAPGVTPAAVTPSLPFATTEVLKMYQGGIGKEILLSYVDSSSAPFRLSADAIIYLHGIGLPQDVIAAMIHRDGDLQRMAAAAPPQGAPPMQQDAAAAQAMAQAQLAAPPQPIVVPSTPAPGVTYMTAPAYPPPYYNYDYGYDYGYPYLGGSVVIGAPLFWGFHGGFGPSFHGGFGGGFHGGGFRGGGGSRGGFGGHR